MTGKRGGFMIVKYEKHIKKSELTNVLIQIYKKLCLSKESQKKLCLSKENRGFAEGSALAVGMIVGYFGIDPDYVSMEAEKANEYERAEHEHNN
jgi:hypothetical protein